MKVCVVLRVASPNDLPWTYVKLSARRSTRLPKLMQAVGTARPGVGYADDERSRGAGFTVARANVDGFDGWLGRESRVDTGAGLLRNHGPSV